MGAFNGELYALGFQLLAAANYIDTLGGDSRTYRAALAAQPGAVAADCDVRKIMLDVVPGWDGEGVEVYAKSVAEVEAKLGEIWAELEEWQMGIRKLAAAPTEAKPAQDAVDAWVHFDELYIKACATSLPTHWMDAALAAQQIRAAISAKKGQP